MIVEARGHVAVLTLARPERKNALNRDAFHKLAAAIETLPRARAIVVTGAPPAFCAGMDVNTDNPHVNGIMEAVQQRDRAPVDAMLGELRAIVDRLFALPVPIIAAVNGLAYGGGAELASRCDLRVLDPAATICFSETKLGLMPDWGGGVALTRLIGPARAADLILTGRKIDANEAMALGLANRLSAPGASVAEAVALAESIAANGPRAVRSALEVIRRTPDMPLHEALALELDRASALIASGECVFGIGAFLSRTPPSFPDPE
jgi:enoyl-CoA hydratase/carnithine racemase